MADELPKHIAIIMDGNGRWANQQGLPRSEGHQAGYQAARRIVRYCGEIGIKFLTLFAFSSENWGRPNAEVQHIMNLFYSALTQEIDELHQNQVRLKVIGDMSQLSRAVQEKIITDENLTQNNTGLTLLLAVNYGGRWDIVQATQQIAQKVANHKLELSEINESLFSQHLATNNCPDPDLLIRPSSEQRISNFLIWQLAYAEIYFTTEMWPDFNPGTIDQAIQFYRLRERRFGLTSAQIKATEGSQG